jgi:hypothetical protein
LAIAVGLLIAAFLFQTCLRYEYTVIPAGGVYRVDRLNGTVCIAFPPVGMKRFRCRSPWP